MSLLVGLVVVVATTNRIEKTTDCLSMRYPLRGFKFAVDKSQQKQFVKQLQEFAEKHDFKFDIVYFSESGEIFRITMIRKDVELVIANSVGNLDEFYSAFNNYDCVHPTVAADIDELTLEFKSLLSQVPNVMIIEEH